MKYRLAKKSDFNAIGNFCMKHRIKVPLGNLVTFVAVDEDAQIVGVAGLKQMVQFEPLISDNPVVANNLFRMVEGVIMSNEIPKVRAIADPKNEKYVITMAKQGFEVIETDKIILQKEY